MKFMIEEIGLIAPTTSPGIWKRCISLDANLSSSKPNSLEDCEFLDSLTSSEKMLLVNTSVITAIGNNWIDSINTKRIA